MWPLAQDEIFLNLELCIFILCLEWFTDTAPWASHGTPQRECFTLTPAYPRLVQIQVSNPFPACRKVENALLAKHSGMWAPAECSRAGDGHRLQGPVTQMNLSQSETFALDFPQIPIVQRSHFLRRAADTEKTNKTVWQNCQCCKLPHQLMVQGR